VNKYTLFFYFCLSIISSFSQEAKISLDVKVTSVERMREKLENTTVILYKNDNKADSTLLKKEKYKVALDTGNVYKVVFKKASYVTKYIILNTKDAPETAKKSSKLKIDIGLFHAKEELDVDFLKNEPIGYARYDFISEKMAWDKAYLKLMKGKIIRATLDYAKSKEY
jgi:hypothetical protein